MEKYSTKENETYREHAEKAVHKVEEHGQQARHNLQENMQKLKDDAEEAAIEAKNEARTGVHKMAGKIEEAGTNFSPAPLEKTIAMPYHSFFFCPRPSKRVRVCPDRQRLRA